MTLNPAKIEARLELAKEIAREAGAVALDYFRKLSTLVIEEKKGAQDVVSIADREVERMIRARIGAAFPNDAILGEEEGYVAGASDATWVIDPIDGTTPFLAGMPSWCVSIAVVIEGEIAIGVIYVPVADELFWAGQGFGAHLGGAPIAVDLKRDLSSGVLGLGANPRLEPALVARVVEALLANGGMFYRNGSGALMLAYVACGRLVGYFEDHINSWDCLAGLCLIAEAGGWHNDFLAHDGLTKGNWIMAGPPQIRDALHQLRDSTR